MEPSSPLVAEIPQRRRSRRAWTAVFVAGVAVLALFMYLSDSREPSSGLLGARSIDRHKRTPSLDSRFSRRPAEVAPPKRMRTTPTSNKATNKASNKVAPPSEDDRDEDPDYDDEYYDSQYDEDEATEAYSDDADYEPYDDTPLRFFDVDNDRISFKIGKKGQLCEFVNGECEVRRVTELHYDRDTRTITDDAGSFKLQSREKDYVVWELMRLARCAVPRVKLLGFPKNMRDPFKKKCKRADEEDSDDYESSYYEDDDEDYPRMVPVMNHEELKEAINHENVRLANSTKAINGMESMLATWKTQLEEEEKLRSTEGLPNWQRIHLASSTKRRKKDIELLEYDIKAMQQAREYMEDTITLFQQDLNRTNSGPELPPLPPCRSVPASMASGDWGFNPLFTGAISRTETPNSYVVTINAPGMSMDDLSVTVKDAKLIVKGAIEQILEGGACVQKLDREFDLPVNADAKQVSASFANGILTVEVPKVNSVAQGEEKNVKITVESSSPAPTPAPAKEEEAPAKGKAAGKKTK